MANSRGRCIYCDDSRATDVDHFEPIARDFAKTFEWANHLWSCADCNRRKATRFPVVGGQPTLVNPVEENWWLFLSLDTATGILAPAFSPSGEVNRRGTDTLCVFRALSVEAVVEGRRRVIVDLRTAVAKALHDGDTRTTREALSEAVKRDDYGVASWFALGRGVREQPFADLYRYMPVLWRRFVRWTVAREYGG